MHYAGEVMRRNVEFCTPETVTPDIKYLMKSHNYEDLLVVDNMRDQHIIGVVHGSSVSDEALKNEIHPFQLRASHFMDIVPPSVDKKVSVDDCLKIMSDSHLTLLPVMDEKGKCIGIVKKEDLLRFL